MNKIHKRANKGFTLLEILLVIAAIGILAAIVLVAINPNRQIAQARNAERRADINTIYKALEQYLIDNQDYPAGIDETPRDICGTTTGCVNLGEGVLVPTYMAAIPVDPTGVAYIVRRNSDNNRISVTATEAELGQSIAINPQPPTPEELIQAQIAEGTLIPTGTQQLVLNRLVYTNNEGTQTYIDKPTANITCPANYIPVPGNSMYGTSDFCVMKYEAKTGSGTVAATTQAEGTPQVNISQTDSITACSLNGAGYGLINNAEWMTIARNIEAQSVNWTGGSVGSGGLYRGHGDGSPNNSLEANTDDNPYFATNDSGTSRERRTHTLSNGEVIWDLSGNVWEWISDTILGQNKPQSSTSEFTSITSYGDLSYDLMRPSNNSWNSSKNMGIYNAGTVTGTATFAFLRGGNWWSSPPVGVFSLALDATPSNSSAYVGFRCVLR